MSAHARHASIAVRRKEEEPRRRDWFLTHSSWHDVVWIFKPTNVLEEERPVRIRWDFALPSGKRFTDPAFASLLESSRTLIAITRARGLTTGLPLRATTVSGFVMYLRELVRFMDREGLSRFCELDGSAVLRFQRTVERRTTHRGAPLARTTVEKYLELLVYLHRYRAEIGDGLTIEPFPGLSPGQSAGVTNCTRAHWPYTPEPIAVSLVKGAIEFLSGWAVDLLLAREIYADTMATVQRHSHSKEAWREASARALKRVTLQTAKGRYRVSSTAELAQLLDRLYAACFVVISYLVGPRVSEVLQLRSGCVQALASEPTAPDTGLAVIAGAIFKREPAYHGRPHQWVAPPPAVHAVAVLEALSAPHRERSGRSELWLRARGRHNHLGAKEWHRGCTAPLRLMRDDEVRELLYQCNTWFDLPLHEGEPWRLTTHQGRKTFARFAALRDRSALYALAQHLGHRERAITDCGYVGTDYRLAQEIDAAVLEQSVSAWEYMLSTPRLGGRAGAEILASRPRFRGSRMKPELEKYARMLVDSGLTLGVCDWGFCVYRQEHSACLGSVTGPSPLRREPSTCATCRNFAISPRHRTYWLQQVQRNEALLKEPTLPTQTLKIARDRFNEARKVLRSIDSILSRPSYADTRSR
jgi:integrase